MRKKSNYEIRKRRKVGKKRKTGEGEAEKKEKGKTSRGGKGTGIRRDTESILKQGQNGRKR